MHTVYRMLKYLFITAALLFGAFSSNKTMRKYIFRKKCKGCMYTLLKKSPNHLDISNMSVSIGGCSFVDFLKLIKYEDF